ncbi:hypothetical protein ACSVDA_24645 [Cytobacillus sp. Hm23]
MRCKKCDTSDVVYCILEETSEGYVYQVECNECDYYDTGYEF